MHGAPWWCMSLRLKPWMLSTIDHRTYTTMPNENPTQDYHQSSRHTNDHQSHHPATASPPPRPNRLAQSTKRNTTTTTNVIFTPGPHRACQCPLLIIILVAVFLPLCLSLFRHCLLIISFAIAQTLQSPSPLVFNYHNCFFSNSQEPLKKHSQHRTRMAKVSERSLDLPWSFSHNTAPRLALLCSFHGDVHINCLTVKH